MNLEKQRTILEGMSFAGVVETALALHQQNEINKSTLAEGLEGQRLSTSYQAEMQKLLLKAYDGLKHDDAEGVKMLLENYISHDAILALRFKKRIW